MLNSVPGTVQTVLCWKKTIAVPDFYNGLVGKDNFNWVSNNVSAGKPNPTREELLFRNSFPRFRCVRERVILMGSVNLWFIGMHTYLTVNSE